MKTVNSVSGGKTSAYMAAHYPADYNVFALVRIEDKACAPADPIIKQEAEKRLGVEFVATAEEDETILSILDLEQFIGKPITWVTGPTFDETLRKGGGVGRSYKSGSFLPNAFNRFCTTAMKMEPIFYWWAKEIGQPVEMQIGYRPNETTRAKSILDETNKDGLSEFKATFEKNKRGHNKWEMVPWRKPTFPLIENNVFKWQIENFWQGQPVRFPRLNNCVGCFHRSPILLRKQWDWQTDKMQWFSNQETNKKRWVTEYTYQEIGETKLQLEFDFFTEMFAEDLESCSSGLCGI